jgi:hypothetical protein
MLASDHYGTLRPACLVINMFCMALLVVSSAHKRHGVQNRTETYVEGHDGRQWHWYFLVVHCTRYEVFSALEMMGCSNSNSRTSHDM